NNLHLQLQIRTCIYLKQVEFSDGSKYEYPSVFLQDNCTCPSCYHPSSQSRLRKLTDLNLDNKISSLKTLPDGNGVECKWMDGHIALFSEEWLKARRFTDDNIKIRKAIPRDNPQLAGANVTFPRESFKSMLSDDQKLLEMLQQFSKRGIFMLEGAPLEVGQLRKLGDKIGFIRLTHYGYEFTVKSEPNAVNLAYTSARLGVHTDLPYYVYPPGVQLLHCIKQYAGNEGGQSHLVDGFRVAQQMKEKYPEEYKILCEVPVEFYDVGTDYTRFFKVHHSPTFVLNPENGSMVRVVYSNQVLSSYMPLQKELVKSVYTALKTFTDLCYEPENLIEFKLQEGEVLIFDNWRFLHGREGFDTSKGHRHLEGCYIDWDEIYSRIRVIENDMRK
ncbi:Gamma-butyrobetaine dioxygenase, partial [Orchesella cincta]